MNSSNLGFFTVSKSNALYFPESMSNDLIIATRENTQNILFGLVDSPSVMKITNSNVSVGGSFDAKMIAVGGQIIGTGTNVVFSPISTGWSITDQADPAMGIGLGPQRVQLANSFLQWQNTTFMPVTENQSFSSNSIANIGFQYNTLSSYIPEQTFLRGNISIIGKQLSQDFILSKDSDKYMLTGPAGIFTLGFDLIETNLNLTNHDYNENIILRCYYNKKTENNNATQGYYPLKGSQFITVMLPSSTQFYIQFNHNDNPNTTTFELKTSCILRITRLTVIE
jgi:hypothetical protein